MTYSTVFLAMLSIASGQSVDIGTDCECSVTVVSSDTTISPAGSSHSGVSFTSESTDPLDVWSGLNVFFQGTSTETFDYRIDCAHSCSISQVDLTGVGWCNSTLQLYNGNRSELLAESNLNVDYLTDYAPSLVAGTDYLTSFRFVETDERETCTWRGRSSFSIVAEVEPSNDDCDALPIDIILSKCSANYAATGADILALQRADNTTEARLRELEEWKETLLSMSAAQSIRSAEEDMGSSAGVTVSDLYVHDLQALVVCLAVVNVVLLGCLCVSSRKSKGVVYDAVRAADKEELCA